MMKTPMRYTSALILSFSMVPCLQSDAQQTNTNPKQNRAPLGDQDSLATKACRSVKLWYFAPESEAFYNEVTVKQSAPGTYFMVCGWRGGYFGIQDRPDGTKRVLFSVWDSSQNDKNAVDEDKRVKLLHKDDDVRIGRFGNEGTGGQSFFDYDWKVGVTYRFRVRALILGDRTAYAGYFYVPEERVWKHLVTFSTITGGRTLRGYYSFIEDYKRDTISATKRRAATYGNAWVETSDGKKTNIQKARFTGDRNPATNINAKMVDGLFQLSTGGNTTNSDTQLREIMNLETGKTE
jgi:hypothetical protein